MSSKRDNFKIKTIVKLELEQRLCWALCNILGRGELNKLDGTIETDQKKILADFGQSLAGHMGGQQHPILKHPILNPARDGKVLSWYALSADRKKLLAAVHASIEALGDPDKQQNPQEARDLLLAAAKEVDRG